jgi:hypothetical protein
VAGLDLATYLSGNRAGNQRLVVTLVDRETAYVWKLTRHTIAAGTSEAGAQQTVYAAWAHTRNFAVADRHDQPHGAAARKALLNGGSEFAAEATGHPYKP